MHSSFNGFGCWNFLMKITNLACNILWNRKFLIIYLFCFTIGTRYWPVNLWPLWIGPINFKAAEILTGCVLSRVRGELNLTSAFIIIYQSRGIISLKSEKTQTYACKTSKLIYFEALGQNDKGTLILSPFHKTTWNSVRTSNVHTWKWAVTATRRLPPISGVARACAHAQMIFTTVSKRDEAS